jgi:geranylgeranyl diphosphate synthase type I
VTGKPTGGDLSEGKRTVLVALALDALPAEDAKILDGRLGTALAPEEVARLQQLIEESGAREQVEHVIGELTERAVAALDAAGITEEARGVLRGLAAAATQRNL